ncbi:ATP-binding protein [Spirosoma soli]|uniref:histidine kinase n=1 Tax=Spirosoma soli TaxID=1770529 RepID=A0ABW5M1W0_9BACT
MNPMTGKSRMERSPASGMDGLPFSSLLINAIPGNHLVLLLDAPTFTIAAVSDEYLAALNLQREALVGYGVFEVFFEKGRNQVMSTQLEQSLNQVLRTKQAHLLGDQPFEWPSTRRGVMEGRICRLANKPVINPNGELAYIIHTVEDITAEVQLVEVAEANRYLQTIINWFKEPMQVLKPVIINGEIIDFCYSLTNQAYADYAHATPQQLQGKRVSKVFPGYFETVSFTNSVETFKTGQPLTFDIHYDKDGLDLYNRMSTFKFDGEVVIHFTDFTQLRQLQRQLENKIDELSRSNENLQQFAYVASHDLQEPLRKIQQFGDLLKIRNAGAPGEELIYIERMQSAAKRMSTLIKDLLDFSRISTQRDACGPVSLQTVVESVLSTLELRVEELGAQIQVGLLPTVSGDVSQLSQLFQNLLSNALKFHRVGIAPVIVVEARLLASDQLPSGVKPGRVSVAYHQIKVIDNGIGFDDKYADRIFQVFQRLHGKNEYAGTGIGLAICEKVVANHGGAITATSQPGHGATFTIYLPA